MAISGLPTNNGDNLVTVTPTGIHSVDGQGGTDTLNMDYSTLSNSIDFRYIANGYYGYRDDFYSGVDFINFERFILRGGSAADKLQGGNLNDELYGGAGSDTLTSGLGADIISGGTGYDRWVADYSGIGNTNVSATLVSTGAATIGGTGASVSSIEDVTLTTAAGSDLLDTRAVNGNDSFSGGAGNDEFRSAGGFDYFNGELDTDRLVLDYSDATSQVKHWYVANGWYAVGDKLSTQSANYINVELFDITGGSAGDILEGANGNDRLVGNGGNDRLYGYGGVDTISGGDGNDTWIVDYSARAGTTVNLETQTASSGAVLSGIEAVNYTGSGGIDTVTASAGAYNDAFNTAGGNDTITSGRGVDSVNGGTETDKLVMNWSAIADPLHGITHGYVANGWYRYASKSGDRLDYINIERFDLTGGAGGDTLFGGAYYDWLRGNGGDDELNSGVGDALIDGGAGIDRWIADLSGESAAVNIDAALSQTEVQGSGAGLNIRNIEALTISTGVQADTLSTEGFASNDSFYTGAGADYIKVGLGFDAVDGQGDADLLKADYSTMTTDIQKSYVANGWYRYTDLENTASVDFINVERFYLIGGAGNDSFEGGTGRDYLYGNAGDDILNGGAGNDVISGGAGTDTWIGDYGAMTGNLSIAVNASGNGTLTGVGTTISSIERVNLVTGVGDDSIDLTNSTGNDNIASGSGADFVDVGRGKFDVADGGIGTDTLAFDMASSTSAVRMEYYANGWYHAISADGRYEMRFINFESFVVDGSAYADRIDGFGGADTLRGAGGNDIITGNQGNDTLTGGTGVDQFYFGNVLADGVDTITDASAGDFLRLAGVALNGPVTTGNGGGLMAGQVQVETAGGITSVHVGVDGAAGADFHVNLVGSYLPSGLQLTGSDLQIL